ncbi:TrbI/VirB10 family protein [Novosphingobium sp. Fuku2-ISO-50]|uniref:TrbI/VirB10 family protein n=1 Tax=Novosphingobium sp. Fuku2-ISO-50 TaxID=1739114 RepID=UPI00076C43B2|nr:TrbI/VirB10 family protein [Novosphingobium sp. Fuku2-ISO-50]KUR75347.1 conjugal transfer protein TraB [Novosphingobium sp. Fuku2-ISO-50]
MNGKATNASTRVKADGTDDLAHNAAVRRRQHIALYAIGGLLLAGGAWWIIGSGTPATTPEAKASDPATVKISTDDMVNRSMADKEWMALSENQLTSQGTAIKTLQGDSGRIDQLQKQIDDLQGQNQALKTDGSKVLSAYQTENEQLRSQVSALSTQVQRATAGPNAMYGPGAPATYQRAGAAPTSGTTGATGTPVVAAPRSSEVKLMAFSGDASGTAARIVPTKTTQFTDSENYLPPNSIATARVVVGVDATTNTKSQTDPLPVVLRITGPARSVYAQGKLLKTNLSGCMVNGAAMGDLSSEKVYVKLQRMTCPQPGGRVAVSDVKGFIAFGGKTGVRGRVVNRSGNLVGQAFIAGVLGGFGRGFATNSQAFLTSPTVNTSGQPTTLSPSSIVQGGLGQGVAQSADTVSKYLIERAEQYQPVVEMPTGLDVEVVFLDGVFIRN